MSSCCASCSRAEHLACLLSADCGKSAARVGCGAVPKSVHSWRIPSTATAYTTTAAAAAAAAVAPVSRTALADPRNLCMSGYLPLPAAAPCILHYVVCGYTWFCDKYQLLGQFDSAWFGGRLPIAPSFHLDSRDAVQQQQQQQHNAATTSDTAAAAAASSGATGVSNSGSSSSSSAARSLYDAQVAVCSERDAATIANCLQLGVCERITEPQRVITKAKRDRAAACSTISSNSSDSVKDTVVNSTVHTKTSADASTTATTATTGATAVKPVAVAASNRSADAAQALLIASIAGLQLGSNSSSSNGSSSNSVSTAATAAAASVSTASAASNSDTQGAAGYERAWILSSIARNYL
jgi:hypothetical protein